MLALTQAISDLSEHVKNEKLAVASTTKAPAVKAPAAKAAKPAAPSKARAARPKQQ